MESRAIPRSVWTGLALGASAVLLSIVVAGLALFGGHGGDSVVAALGLAALVAWVVLGGLAIVRGVAGWRQIRREPDALRGRPHAACAIGLGTTALLLGAAPLVLMAAVGLWESRLRMGHRSTTEVVDLIENDDADIRLAAARELTNRRGQGALTGLGRALGSADLRVKSMAASALLSRGPEAGPIVDALTRALNDADPDVRRCAVGVLGAIGPRAASAIPALERLTADPSEWRTVAHALTGLGEPGQAALLRSLDSEHGHVRSLSFDCLAWTITTAVASNQRLGAAKPIIDALHSGRTRGCRGAAWVVAALVPREMTLDDHWRPLADSPDSATRLAIACRLVRTRVAADAERARTIVAALDMDPLSLVEMEPVVWTRTLLDLLPNLASPEQVDPDRLRACLTNDRLRASASRAIATWAERLPRTAESSPR